MKNEKHSSFHGVQVKKEKPSYYKKNNEKNIWSNCALQQSAIQKPILNTFHS